MRVRGFCPICAYPDPIVSEEGFLVCASGRCPKPEVVGKVLLDEEICHRVLILDEQARDGDDYRWVVKHPLRERVEDELFRCEISGVPIWDIVENRMASLPLEPGEYRITEHPDWVDHLDNPEYAGGPWGWEKVG